MPRVPYFDLDQASPAYREMLGSRRPLNLYRMLPHAGPAAEGFLALGGALLRKGALDPKLRELAIIRVGLLSGASYEVHQHRRLARSIGLSQEKIDAIVAGVGAPPFDELDNLVLEFTDELFYRVKAPDAMFERLCTHLDYQQVAELVLTVGFYMMVSRFLENFEVEIEPASPEQQSPT